MVEKYTEEQLTALENDYRAAAISVRGTYLQAVTDFEFQIEMFIGFHFTTDITKFEEILGLMVSQRLGFTGKFQVFEFLIDRYHPINKGSKGIKKYAVDIKEIIMYRNTFAHSPTSVSDESLIRYKKDRSLEFLKLKNHTKKDVSKLSDAFIVKDKVLNKVIENIYNYTDSLRQYNNTRLSTPGFLQDEP